MEDEGKPDAGLENADGAPQAPAPENVLRVEVISLRDVPKQCVHPDAGEAPLYPDCVFGYAFELRSQQEDEDGNPVLRGELRNGRIHQLDKTLENMIDTHRSTGNVETTVVPLHEPSVVDLRTSRTAPSLEQYRKAAADTAKNSDEDAASAATASAAQQTAVTEGSKKGGSSSAPSAVSNAKPDKDPPRSNNTPDAPALEPQSAATAAPLVATWFFPEDVDPAAEEGEDAVDGPHVLTLPLTAAQVELLELAVDGSAKLQFHVRRILRSAKAGAEWEDVNEPKYRAQGDLVLGAFAEPGATVHTFEEEVRFFVPPEEKGDDKKAKKAPPKKAPKGGTTPAFLLSEEEFDVHPYESGNTRVCFKLSFDKPVVCLPGDRPRPDLLASDLLAPKAKPMQQPPDSAKVLCSEIRDIVDSIVLDYRSFSSVEFTNTEDCRKAFLQYLSTSGRSFAHRQRLKHCTIRIVKEKFSKKAGTTKADMERFYNELYVYLLDQMHRGLNSVFNRENLSPAAFQPAESKGDKWHRLAQEAEIVKDYEAAERYHQERLVNAPGDTGAHADPQAQAAELPVVWGSYARFCLRMRDTMKAEQALREAIAVDIAHVPTLLDYSLLLLANDRHKEAEVYLHCAVDSDLNSPLSWGCLWLFCERAALAPDCAADTAASHRKWGKYAKAMSLRAQRGLPVQKVESVQGSDPPEPPAEPAGAEGNDPSLSVEMVLAGRCAELRLEQLAYHCIAQERRHAGDSLAAQLLEGRLHYQVKETDKAVDLLKGVLKKEPDNVAAIVLCGDCYAEMAACTEALCADSECPAAKPADAEPSPPPAQDCAAAAQPSATPDVQREGTPAESEAAEDAAPQAQQPEAEAPEAEPAPEGQAPAAALPPAEAANTPSPSPPPAAAPPTRDDVAKHLHSAEALYAKALAVDGQAVDAKVAIRLGNIYASLGRYDDAANVYILAAQKWRCGVAWQGIGIAYYRLGRYAESEQALNESNLLNNYNARTWTYISLVCLRQGEGRENEADTAFRHALKLGLQDGAILAELSLSYFNAGRLQLAEASCRKSLESRNVSSTHSLLARCLVASRKISEAREHYVQAHDLATSSCERAKAMDALKELEQVQDE